MKVGLKTNIIIDILMLVAMALTSISGIVLKVIAPLRRRGSSEEVREFANWFFQGCGRRLWVDIHIWAGVVLLALLVLHIIFHWTAIDGFFKKHIPNGALRKTLYGVLLLILLLSTIPWFWAF